MKLLSVILFSTLAAFAVAQGIVIRYPPANKYIHPVQNLTVQVVQPDSIIGPIIVGLAIGLEPCSAGCQPANVSSGEINLYVGPYKPVLHKQDPRGGFYQNFTVFIPSGIPKGKAHLNVALAGLIGASNSLIWETTSKTLNVV
ncbi:hypothetical protein F5887DRAFT_1075924 [Amanita rubescens]|nr:hypothetical protein F5887DRAFT_1075924 [Amanita rubescens]